MISKNPADGRPGMEYANAVITLVGFFIIGYYQKQKIGALEKQLSAERELLRNTKTFIDLFDLEKLKGYGEIVEKKVRMEMECQVEQIKRQFSERQEKHKDNMLFMFGELMKATDTFGRALVYLPKTSREKVINDMVEGPSKQTFLGILDKINTWETEARISALQKALAEIIGVSDKPTIEISKASGSV